MEYTREELLKICARASVPQERWSDRDTASAQIQLGQCYALLRAGCDFTARDDPNFQGRMIDIWIIWRGFNWFEGSLDPSEAARNALMDDDTFYLPTPERLAAVRGGDWYC